MTNMKALKDAIKLVADASKDFAAKGGPFSYLNLVPDLFPLSMELGDVPSEIAQMVPADYLALASELVTDLGVSDAKIGLVISKALVILNIIVMELLPAGHELMDAVKASK